MKFIKMHPKLIPFKNKGNTPILQVPRSLKNLIRLKNELKAINSFTGEEIAYLTHKPISSDDAIPAASRRFIKSIAFLFSNNKKWYETTFFDEDKQKLIFVYDVSFAEILDAINKIEKTIEFLDENLEISIEKTLVSFFDDNNKDYWKNKISQYKFENNLTIFSITSLREVLSKLETTYEKFWIANKEVDANEKEMQSLVFVSSKAKDQAKNILIKDRVQIWFEDDVSLDVKGNFNKKLPGFIYSKPISQAKAFFEKNHRPSLEKALHSKLRQEDLHSTNVGIIDGGIASNSIVLKNLSSYHTNETIFNESNPTGTHAEEVASILLFAKNIPKINDNLPRPKVHLFNVVQDGESISSIKQKIEKIMRLHASEIKIWNLSFVFPGFKNSNAISSLGVFLDKIQKNYDVIFVVPTGNYNNSPNNLIEAPAGSCLALSVSAVNSNYQKTSYSKIGYQKYVSPKPDLAIFGGDENDLFPVISNNMISHSMGTSLAVPLVVRKLSFLVSKGLKIREAVALLINYARYFMFKNNIISSRYNGHGVLPIDTTELMNFDNEKAIIIMDLELETDYKQTILDIKIPRTQNNQFDFSYFVAINTNAILEKNDTFEYVLDSARIIFGKVYGKNLHNWKADDRKMDIENEEDLGEKGLESNLRTYKGKYKNRDAFKKELSRIIKPTFTVKGKEYNIESWGIKITRNSLLQEGRKEKMKTAICMIIESKSMNTFISEFILENENIIENINGIAVNENLKINKKIQFI